MRYEMWLIHWSSIGGGGPILKIVFFSWTHVSEFLEKDLRLVFQGNSVDLVLPLMCDSQLKWWFSFGNFSKNNVLIRVNLYRRRVIVDPECISCPFCKEFSHSVSYLFITCDLTWYIILDCWGGVLLFLRTLLQFLFCLDGWVEGLRRGCLVHDIACNSLVVMKIFFTCPPISVKDVIDKMFSSPKNYILESLWEIVVLSLTD